MQYYESLCCLQIGQKHIPEGAIAIIMPLESAAMGTSGPSAAVTATGIAVVFGVPAAAAAAAAEPASNQSQQ